MILRNTSTSGDLSNKAHEITHAGQILAGLVDVDAGSTNIKNMKIGITAGVLEHQAYKANYAINGDKNLGFGSIVTPICGLDDLNFNSTVDEGKSHK